MFTSFKTILYNSRKKLSYNIIMQTKSTNLTSSYQFFHRLFQSRPLLFPSILYLTLSVVVVDVVVVVVAVVVVCPPPRISWSSHPLTTPRSQSRFPLLDYLYCSQRLFPQTAGAVLCWYLTAI